MADDVTFLDLACLMKISEDTTLEKFGSAINASIFDASNIAGTLKQKDLIDFTSIFPGPNSIAVTDNGKAVLSEAEQRSATPFDNLDKSIITQISNGRSSPKDIQGAISLNSRDLAMRLYKLNKQNLLTYELKSGNVEILLTEQGFLKASPQHQQQVQTAPPVQQPIPGIHTHTEPQPAPQPQQPILQPEIQQPIHLQPKPIKKKTIVVAAIVIIVILIVLAYLLGIR